MTGRGYRGKQRNGRAVFLAGAILIAAAVPLRFFVYGFSFSAALLLAMGVLLALFGALSRVPADSGGAGAARIIRRALLALLAAGVMATAISETAVVRGAKSDPDPKARYVLILGAGLWGSEPSPVLLTRLQAAEEYLKAYPETAAVVSGGQGAGEQRAEAAAMKDWLAAHGIAESRIWTEERAESTEENIRYSMPVLRRAGWDGTEPVALVTSEFHLRRAACLADRYGLETKKVAAETPWPLLRVNFFLREAFALPETLLFG